MVNVPRPSAKQGLRATPDGASPFLRERGGVRLDSPRMATRAKTSHVILLPFGRGEANRVCFPRNFKSKTALARPLARELADRFAN